MERLNKPKYAAGMLLLLLAAFFSVSLMLQPFDFIAYDAGLGSVLFLLGAMLFSVYGFSSVLVPAFLFFAAMACFSGKWTGRKTMRLLTAVVPFFTAVLTEVICKSIAEFSSDFTGIKIGITIALGIMLIVIEWLGAGIIADKIAITAKGAGFEKPSHEKTGTEAKIETLDAFDDIRDTGAAGEATASKTTGDRATAGDETAAGETSGEDDAYSEGRAINALAEKSIPRDKNTQEKGNLTSPFETVFDDTADVLPTGDADKKDDAASVISEAEFTALTAHDDTPLDEIEELAWPDFPAEGDTDAFAKDDDGEREEDEGGNIVSENDDAPFWEKEAALRTKKTDAAEDI